LKKLFVATEEDIMQGRTMDIYFQRSRKVLEALGLEKMYVKAEFSTGSLPSSWKWAVICGTEEVIRLMEGRPIDIYGIPEGTIWQPRSRRGARIPLMNVEGQYCDFGEMETSMLGMLCHASGVATMAARCKLAAGMKPLMAFGNRRMHPALAPMLDRSAYIGGCDGVASPIGAELIGERPMGTVPHALMLIVGDEAQAYKAFDKHSDPDVPRIMLVDTFSDERFGALIASENVPDLEGIRLDTPSSRKGSFRELIQEVRWELDLRGYKDVKIIATGGLDEWSLLELRDAGADLFGIGTSIVSAPTVDFSMDIVERDAIPVSKRGKFSGRKYPFRCPDCFCMDLSLSPEDELRCSCGAVMEMIEEPLIKDGRRVGKERNPSEIRGHVISQLRQIVETEDIERNL